MHLSDQFMLRRVADETLVIPVGEAALRLKGLIGLSESGSLLLERLRPGCTEAELEAALLEEYNVPPETAREDVRAFLEQLRRVGILAED